MRISLREENKNVVTEKYLFIIGVPSSLWNGLKNRVGFVGLYGISTFLGYLTPNPFLCK